MDCSVLLLRHLYRWKRVCIAHNNCMSCPSIWATHLHCSYTSGSSLFLHSDQPLSEGEIIPFSGVQSGRLHYPRRRRWWLHALIDRLFTCNRRRPAATSSRRASFSALASANSCIWMSAATSRWRICNVSNCRVRQLQFSGSIFVALGFVGNGVITVMRQTAATGKTMMITRAER